MLKVERLEARLKDLDHLKHIEAHRIRRLAAAIRSIQDEQTLATRAIIQRWEVYFQNKKQKTSPERPDGTQPVLRLPRLGET
jgi:hypothetical protein